jgi:chromosome segregation ATPase
MPTDTTDAVAKSTAALKEALTTLEAEETRLSEELATVREKRKALSTAVAALDPSAAAPKRRRGRPPGSGTAKPKPAAKPEPVAVV